MSVQKKKFYFAKHIHVASFNLIRHSIGSQWSCSISEIDRARERWSQCRLRGVFEEKKPFGLPELESERPFCCATNTEALNTVVELLKNEWGSRTSKAWKLTCGKGEFLKTLLIKQNVGIWCIWVFICGMRGEGLGVFWLPRSSITD